MTQTDASALDSAHDDEPTPQETDNGPRPGDGQVPDQFAVQIEEPPIEGRTSGVRASDVLARARSHLGTVERPEGSNRQPFGAAYGHDGVPWCNIFVSEVGRQVTGSYEFLGRFMWTPACASWWRQNKRFGRTPQPGAVVFFDWSGSKSLEAIDHVGIVIEALPSGRVRTIEGNARVDGHADGVWIHDRWPQTIVGYGYPEYAGGQLPDEPRDDDTVFHSYQRVKAGSRALRLLDAGDDVKVLQKAIGAPVDGRFGALTRNRLIAFQRAHRLAADAIAGPGVWTVILRKRTVIVDPGTDPDPQREPGFPGVTRRGSHGLAVFALQRRLRARGWRIQVDGDFGPATDRVVRAFQKEKRLAVDGVVGPATWKALWLTPVTRS